MGCFNISGFHSKTPILEGNRIGAIVCINLHYKQMGYGPTGRGIVPIMAPVYGEYNDYGGITNIEENEGTKIFQKVAGMSFNDFIQVQGGYEHLNFGHICNSDSEEYKYCEAIKKLEPKKCEKYLSKLPDELKKIYTYSNSSITVIYEHERILKALQQYGANNRFKNLNKELNDYFAAAPEFENPWIATDIFKIDGENLSNLKHATKFLGLFSHEFVLGSEGDNFAEFTLYKKLPNNEFNVRTIIEKEALPLVDIANGLGAIRSTFDYSMDAGQEFDKDFMLELHKINEEIIKDAPNFWQKGY